MRTAKEIEAKADELRVKLQAYAGQKIGFGMDKIFRQVLQAAFDLVGLVGDLARLIDRAQNQSDENTGASSS